MVRAVSVRRQVTSSTLANAMLFKESIDRVIQSLDVVFRSSGPPAQCPQKSRILGITSSVAVLIIFACSSESLGLLWPNHHGALDCLQRPTKRLIVELSHELYSLTTGIMHARS